MAIENASEVKLFQQTATETLQQQNAAFLAQYPTDDAQIDYYTGLAMRLWDEFEIDGAYDEKGTRKNIATWFENKKKQMELFRKHPYWCEEAKSIIFLNEEERECSFIQARKTMHNLRVYIHHHTGCCPVGDDILSAIEDTFSYMEDETKYISPEMNERFIEVFKYKLRSIKLPKKIERMVSKGTKISRFVRKCCEEFQMNDGTTIDVTKFEDPHEEGDRTFDSFEKRYAKFADSLSTLKTKKMTVISLNFLDFMTMSNGNSWSTCHFINSHGIFHGGDTSSSYRGQYKQGCLSYALDEPSFIFYTLPTDFEGTDYYRCQKLTRMCCQYANGILVTGKCYPNNEDKLITTYRNVLQQIIASIEETPNLWTYSTNTDRICSFVSTGYGAAHYEDYKMSGQKPTISLCRKVSIDIDQPMVIGHRAYCLHCGRELSRDGRNWLQCGNHRRRMVCKCCGKKITEDMTYREIGEHLYCGDCIFYCAVHGRYELKENLHGTIPMEDGEKQVCREAMEVLAQCVDCGVYKHKDRMLRTTNGYACRKHVRKYTKCDCCGVYVLNKEKHVDANGNTVCDECKRLVECLADIRLVVKDSYDIGDYIIVADDVSDDCNGVNDIMENYYPGRITRIHYKYSDGHTYQFKNLRPDLEHEEGRWMWDISSIKCAVIGVNDSCIGKTLAQLGR